MTHPPLSLYQTTPPLPPRPDRQVEQFVVCEGDLEVSRKMQAEMILAAEEFYQSLGIAYRVVNIVSGELNNAAIKKVGAWIERESDRPALPS